MLRHIILYECGTCGNDIERDNHEPSGECPFCGNKILRKKDEYTINVED